MLSVNHIRKAFNNVVVLDDVDFDIKKGEVHALVGGNGAGKSTLMKIITGIYTGDAGEMFLDGKPVHFNNYDEACNHGIRMIFQELSLIPSLTVTQNIFLNHEIKGRVPLLDKEAMRNRSLQLIKRLNVDIEPDTVVGRLSGARQQLVEIAKAISVDPKILVMDEPTASLAETEVETLFDIVDKLKTEGVSIIYISHRMNEILRIADRVTVLRDGKHVVTEDAAKLTVPRIIDYMLKEHRNDMARRIDYSHIDRNTKLLEVKNMAVDGVVNNISFHVCKGEIVGIAGLMGSGRTEILQGVFGVQNIESGEIMVDGIQVPVNRPFASIDAGLALIPENRREEGLILSHSLLKNIVLPSIHSMHSGLLLDMKKMADVTDRNIEKYEIVSDSRDKIVSQLSGGNQQKVVVSKWITINPKVLLFDEPTIGVDIGAKAELVEVIRDYAAQGNAVVFVSSEISEMVAICDRVLILSRGKISGELAGDEIVNETVIQNRIQEHKAAPDHSVAL